MESYYPVTGSNLNPRVLRARYAVRGAVLIRAGVILEEIAAGSKKYPFKGVTSCNIGNPQKLGQQPVTFFREVLALCAAPHVLDKPECASLFPKDAIVKARSILDSIGVGGTGAYSDSRGVLYARKAVANYISERDGYPCEQNSIFITDGASPAIQRILNMLVRDENDAIMIPIPQYPLYSGTLALLGACPVGYFLDEEASWQLRLDELKRAYTESAKTGKAVRALVVINPSNPTGTVMHESEMVEIVKFCKEKGMVLLCDEVYQVNIYPEKMKFISFKKVVRDLGDEFKDFQIVSFHSVSKGVLGECGRRGGYMEVCGFNDEVMSELLKLSSLSLCSNVPGQILTGLMVDPPKPGDESYELYQKETNGTFESLRRRAKRLSEFLNSLNGMSCVTPEGAMYVFPKIEIPPKAVEVAKGKGIAADLLYCLELLEETGIVVVPGSGFRQVEGTYHFRSSILPSEEVFDAILGSFEKFHKGFLARYAASQSVKNDMKSIYYARSSGSFQMETITGYVADSLGELGVLSGSESGQQRLHPHLGRQGTEFVGKFHTMCVSDLGFVYQWLPGQKEPLLVPGLNNIVRVSVGARHFLAVSDNGQLFSWGSAAHGVLGNGDDRVVVKVPHIVESLLGLYVESVSAGWDHSMCVTAGGDVYTWGCGEKGMLGHGNEVQRNVPCLVGSLDELQAPRDGHVQEKVVAVSAGWRHSLVLTDRGRVFSFGLGDCGRLGLGDAFNVMRPQRVRGSLEGEKVVCISAGWGQSACCTDHGEVYMWGYTGHNRLAGMKPTHKDLGGTALPFHIRALRGKRIVSVSTGYGHTLALSDTGNVYGWGRGEWGELGMGRFRDVSRPTLIRSLVMANSSIVNVSAGKSNCSAFVTDAGVLYACGLGSVSSPVKVLPMSSPNMDTQLSFDRSCGSPRRVSSTEILSDQSGFRLIPSVLRLTELLGSKNAAVLTASGAVFAWGILEMERKVQKSSFLPQQNRETPLSVPPSEGKIVCVSVGSHILVVTAAGSVFVCQKTGSSTRVSLPLPAVWCSMGEGGIAMAVLADGALMSWTVAEFHDMHKLCAHGETGTWGTRSPQRVVGIREPVRQVSVGKSHVLALCATSSVRSWGNGSGGELGQSSTDSVAVPTIVGALLGKGVCSVSAGDAVSAAVTLRGDVYVWGSTRSGMEVAPQRISTCPPRVVAVSARAVPLVLLDDTGLAYEFEAFRRPLRCLRALGFALICTVSAHANRAMFVSREGYVLMMGMRSSDMPECVESLSEHFVCSSRGVVARAPEIVVGSYAGDRRTLRCRFSAESQRELPGGVKNVLLPRYKYDAEVIEGSGSYVPATPHIVQRPVESPKASVPSENLEEEESIQSDGDERPPSRESLEVTDQGYPMDPRVNPFYAPEEVDDSIPMEKKGMAFVADVVPSDSPFSIQAQLRATGRAEVEALEQGDDVHGEVLDSGLLTSEVEEETKRGDVLDEGSDIGLSHGEVVESVVQSSPDVDEIPDSSTAEGDLVAQSAEEAVHFEEASEIHVDEGGDGEQRAEDTGTFEHVEKDELEQMAERFEEAEPQPEPESEFLHPALHTSHPMENDTEPARHIYSSVVHDDSDPFKDSIHYGRPRKAFQWGDEDPVDLKALKYGTWHASSSRSGKSYDFDGF